MSYEVYNGVVVRTGQLGAQDRDVVNEVIVNDSYFTRLRGNRGSGEFVVDIGAHIGCFAKLWHDKNPLSRIVCVEGCPENIPVLEKNVFHFAEIIQAACTYEPGEIHLLNSIKENGTATGGSIVIRGESDQNAVWPLYWRDSRALRKITLESIMDSGGVDRIDVLKLDCEGSEFSILENTSSLAKIGMIFGEFHDEARWDEMRSRLFQGWDYGDMHRAGGLGVFHLVNPRGAP